MRPRIAVLAAVLLLVSLQSAGAARFSGNYLLSMCASDKKGNEMVAGGHVACQAYIAGIIDYHNFIRSMGAAPGIDFCVPEQEGLNAIQDQVTSYVYKNRKQHGDFIASPAVAMTLYAYYPCANKVPTQKYKKKK